MALEKRYELNKSALSANFNLHAIIELKKNIKTIVLFDSIDMHDGDMENSIDASRFLEQASMLLCYYRYIVNKLEAYLANFYLISSSVFICNQSLSTICS